MQNHYEINVSKNGRHFFATAARSAVDDSTARQLFETLRDKFPESEGYQVTATHWQAAGKRLEW